MDVNDGAKAASYEIVPASACRSEDIVAVLAAVFDRATIGDAWFSWKHHECPFGPSQGWIARDDEGIAGVRLFTPWPWETSAGLIPGIRPMDGGVLPRARKRGIFQALVRKEMELREQAGAPVIALSTSVPASRAAYVRLAWDAVGDLHQFASPIVPRPARLVHWDVTPDPDGDGVHPTGIHTAWTPQALRWRFDPRSGYEYQPVRLERASAANGLVYRVITIRGLRALAVEYLCGPSAERHRLVQAAAATARAVVVLRLGGPGARRPDTALLARRVGSSMLTSWSVGVRDALGTDRLTSWGLDMADTEGVL